MFTVYNLRKWTKYNSLYSYPQFLSYVLKTLL
jgi:hypothetical protein